jgi:hypothetical protein
MTMPSQPLWSDVIGPTALRSCARPLRLFEVVTIGQSGLHAPLREIVARVSPGRRRSLRVRSWDLMWKRGGIRKRVIVRGNAVGHRAVVAVVITGSLLGQLRK